MCYRWQQVCRFYYPLNTGQLSVLHNFFKHKGSTFSVKSGCSFDKTYIDPHSLLLDTNDTDHFLSIHSLPISIKLTYFSCVSRSKIRFFCITSNRYN